MAGSRDESRLNPDALEFFPTRNPNHTFFRRLLLPVQPQPIPFRLPPLPFPPPPSYWPVDHFRSSSQQSRGGGSNRRIWGGGRNPPPPRPPRMSWRPRSRAVTTESGEESSAAVDELVYSRIVKHRDYDQYRPTRFRKEMRRKMMPLKPGHSTVMIRNIPNKYTREMLMEFLDEHCFKENKKLLDNQPHHASSTSSSSGDDDDDGVISAYDFLYLPFDLSRKLNLGYAFVNFTHPGAVEKFKGACHNKLWQHCGSRKICEIAAASLQGKEALMKQFEKAGFDCEEEEFLPVSFSPPGRGSGMPFSQTTVGILLRKKNKPPLPT